MAPPTKRSTAPGDFVQATCTRCKEVLRHTIVALVDGRPVRVRCNICGGEHAYRPPSGAPPLAAEKRTALGKEPAPPAGRSSRARQNPKTLAGEWATQVAAAGDRERQIYSAVKAFRAGEVVEHPTFGAGVVQRIREPGKILVLFASGAKTLVCAKD